MKLRKQMMTHVHRLMQGAERCDCCDEKSESLKEATPLWGKTKRKGAYCKSCLRHVQEVNAVHQQVSANHTNQALRTYISLSLDGMTNNELRAFGDRMACPLDMSDILSELHLRETLNHQVRELKRPLLKTVSEYVHRQQLLRTTEGTSIGA